MAFIEKDGQVFASIDSEEQHKQLHFAIAQLSVTIENAQKEIDRLTTMKKELCELCPSLENKEYVGVTTSQ